MHFTNKSDNQLATSQFEALFSVKKKKKKLPLCCDIKKTRKHSFSLQNLRRFLNKQFKTFPRTIVSKPLDQRRIFNLHEQCYYCAFLKASRRRLQIAIQMKFPILHSDVVLKCNRRQLVYERVKQFVSSGTLVLNSAGGLGGRTFHRTTRRKCELLPGDRTTLQSPRERIVPVVCNYRSNRELPAFPRAYYNHCRAMKHICKGAFTKTFQLQVLVIDVDNNKFQKETV